MPLNKYAEQPKKKQAPKQQPAGTPYITSGLVGAGIGGGLGWGASHLLWKKPSKKQQLLLALLGVGGGAATGALVAQSFAPEINAAVDTAKDVVTGRIFADPTKDSAGSTASNVATGLGSYAFGNRLTDALWTRPRQLRDMLVQRYGQYLKHTKGAQPAVTQTVDSFLKSKVRPAPKTTQRVAKLISLHSQRNKNTAPILNSIEDLSGRIAKDTTGLDPVTKLKVRSHNLLDWLTGKQGRTTGGFIRSWFRLPNIAGGVLSAGPAMALQRWLRSSQAYKGA